MKNKGVVDFMIEDLGSDDPSIRATAIECLLGSPAIARRAVPALKKVMEDQVEDFTLRLNAAGAIVRIAPEDPDPLQILIDGLTNPIGLLRATTCQFIGDWRDKNLVLRAMPLLCDSDFSVRFQMGVTCGRTFGYWHHAVAVCVEEMRSKDQIARFMAQECLYELGLEALNHMDLLSEGMRSMNWESRLDLEEALDELRMRHHEQST